MRQIIMSPKDKSGERFEILCRGCSIRGREAVWQGYVNSIADPQNWEINNSYLTFEEEPNKNMIPMLSRQCAEANSSERWDMQDENLLKK